MREARDRVEVARRKENIRRLAKGMEELTSDTVNTEVQEMCTNLFSEIEERRDQLIRMDNAYKRKRGADLAKVAAKEEVEKEDLKAWEEGREQRVNAWRDFSHKKERVEKKQKMKFGIHAPPIVAEERPSYAKQEDADGRPKGI
jgi:DnaJ family protein C protein 8